MGKKLSKLLGVFCVGLLFALCGITAGASANETLTEVPYLDENGNSVTTEADVPVTVVTENMTEWTDGWYVVDNTVNMSSRIYVRGSVHLILKNDGILYSDQGINVSNGNSITIYSSNMMGVKRLVNLTVITSKQVSLRLGEVLMKQEVQLPSMVEISILKVQAAVLPLVVVTVLAVAVLR